jgi:hypothetical protein
MAASLVVRTAWVVLSSSLTVAVSAQTTIPSYCRSYPPAVGAGQWQSSRVFYSGGRLSYASDSERNRIPDYSYAGYKYGQATIPSVPEVMRLSTGSGDQTARLQQALDQVAARTPDANGIRGALVLSAGTYEIAGSLLVNASGVVLRGSGKGADGTVLRAVGDTPHQRSVVVLGTRLGWAEIEPRTDIVTSFVPVGSRTFDVADASGFAVGDDVVVRHPSTQAWIDAVDGGGTAPDPAWAPGSMDIPYFRRIAAISGRTVTLDAPIYAHLNRSLSTSSMAKASWSSVTQSGVENLRIDIVTAGGEDENHAWTALSVNGAQDSWVRGVAALHYGFAAVSVTRSVRTTVADSDALSPVGIRTGGRFYSFQVGHLGQLALFSRCHVDDARHGLVSSGSQDASGIVFYRCTTTNGHDMEAGHMKWTTGLLFDNVVESGSGTLRIINRGDWGTSHGWGSAHSTAWGFNKGMYVQKPPTAQNYGISAAGSFPTNYPKPGPQGFVEQKAGTLVPASLYEAQLCDRLESGTGGFSGFYRIVARHRGKAVVVQSASTADGANVYQWTYTSSAPSNDEWQFVDAGGGYHRVVNRNSGKALDVASAGTANGSNVQQWAPSSTATNQQWRVEALGAGYYRLTARHSGKVLNVSGAGTDNATNVDTWSWANAVQQQFQIVSVP